WPPRGGVRVSGRSAPQPMARQAPASKTTTSRRRRRLESDSSTRPNVLAPVANGQDQAGPAAHGPEAASAARLQHLASTQLAADLEERLLLELTDPLSRQRVLLADLLERELLVVLEPEALAQDVGLDRAQAGDHLPNLLVEGVGLEALAGLLGLLVLEEVDHLAAVGVGHGTIEAQRLLEQQGLHLLDLGRREAGVGGQLLRGGIAPVQQLELALGLGHLVVRVDHVDGETDGPALVRDGAADRVTDPPAAVGAEAEALAVIEAIDRLHQTDVALLDEVLQGHAAVVEAARDRDHQAQVRLDEA